MADDCRNKNSQKFIFSINVSGKKFRLRLEFDNSNYFVLEPTQLHMSAADFWLCLIEDFKVYHTNPNLMPDPF